MMPDSHFVVGSPEWAAWDTLIEEMLYQSGWERDPEDGDWYKPKPAPVSETSAEAMYAYSDDERYLGAGTLAKLRATLTFNDEE